RQALDRLRLAGEKMPAASRLRTPIAPQVLRLFRRRNGRGIACVNTHDEHIKLLPDGPWERPQAGEQGVEHQRAEAWTLIVVQDQDHGPGTKVLSKVHHSAGLIVKRQRKRELGTQVLLET